jgi:hypothetical protein
MSASPKAVIRTFANAVIEEVHREVFVESNRLDDLMDCADVFVRAGWPNAQALTFRLGGSGGDPISFACEDRHAGSEGGCK